MICPSEKESGQFNNIERIERTQKTTKLSDSRSLSLLKKNNFTVYLTKSRTLYKERLATDKVSFQETFL